MLDRIVETIRASQSFLLASHVRPDGDALGSALAFYHALRALNKDVTVYSQDKVPEIYSFLPGSDRIVNNLENIDRFETAVLLDCSELSRVGDEAERIGAIESLIAIDHHLSNDGSIPLSLVDDSASSTGEILVKLIDRLGIPLTKEMAVNIYTAVITDTGSFRYSNTTQGTFLLASRLVEAGVDPREVSEQVYESKSPASLRLLARAMENLTMELEGRMASIEVNRRMMEDVQALPEHTDGLVDLVRSVAGVRIAVFYYEMPDQMYKMSLRSKGSVDVERLAKLFGGGGHRNASACRVQGSLDDIRDRVRIAASDILREAEALS